MRHAKLSGGGRRIFTSGQVKAVVTSMNIEFGTRLIVEGGGPLRIMKADHLGNRSVMSEWMTRQQALLWLNAFDQGFREARRLQMEADIEGRELVGKPAEGCHCPCHTGSTPCGNCSVKC